jgi:hypothetical protein
MAAAEYYAQELPGNHHPQPQFQQPSAQAAFSQPGYDLAYRKTPPPSAPHFLPQPHQQQQQLQAQPPPNHAQTYTPPPLLQPQQYHMSNARPSTAPYPTGPPPQFAPPPTQFNGYLGAPLQPYRSHSQPARVRFAEPESDLSDSSAYSDSDDSSRRHRHRRSRDSDISRSRDADSRRHHHHHHQSSTKIQRKEHKDRDTFLGAGVGGVIGDMIIPGLGTAAGLVLGGLGGRKYARRSGSEDRPHREHRHRDAFREGQAESRYGGGGVRDAYREGRSKEYSSESEEERRHGKHHGHRRREEGRERWVE